MLVAKEDLSFAPAKNSKNLSEIFSANLTHLRRQLFPGWGGQKRFAEFLGLTPNDISSYKYGRCLPSEERLQDIATRLGMTPEDLCRPLPGVKQTPLPTGKTEDDAALVAEAAWQEREAELKHAVARLEGMVEVLQGQNEQQNKLLNQLQEANFVLRDLLYVGDAPEAKRRREEILERVSPEIIKLVRLSEAF
ncbi:MAG: hypothetical protein LBU79_07010 [Planctomycetota bacterium]|jgi:transcriptional regulator with XRE-family HTH domain|nr:hypothetical protein [Planctomycetota bacterium]